MCTACAAIACAHISLTHHPPPLAERRLLESWVQRAKRHGTPHHQVVTWVRRKIGADIVVWRKLGNGEYGCATPCVLCAKELERFDLRVHCVVQNGPDPAFFSGRMTDEGAPECKMTSRQKLQIRRSAQGV